ncbi:7TM diverse intracellular signaling domain-containing protein [Leptospira jelokensis]|uniref:Transcriptional regulator n=2 Tax=Leptospira jelokensis TaxID=2484931 RepID=A0A4Z0ZUA6_9LEPT|nr:7TM diverse intracellular signaling domain-containing protein [Leptospira jelokensis]TGL72130.1 transcriptional regulator [Leptospira jelokensis]TGM06158.1 transcriptional regulator [Leptospira jelokensis]
MSLFRLTFVFFQIFLFLPLFANPTPSRFSTILKNDVGEYPLGFHMEILELPPSKILSFQEVQKSTDFNESRTISPNFGFTKNVYWVRFELKNNSNQRDWFIHVSYPLLDKIDFYESKDKDWNHVVTGDSYLFRERPLEEKSFIFPIKLLPKKNNTYYFRFESEGTVQFPITVYSHERFLKLKEKENLSLGIYYGILFVLVIYNLILLFMLKDFGYLYYLLYISFYGLSQSVLNGLAFQIFWPNSPHWANISLPFVGGFSLFWGLQFTRSFLNTKKNTPTWDKIILFLMGLMLLLMLSSFVFSYYINIYLLASLVMFFAIVVFLVAVVCWDKGYKPARYFLIAWVALLFGVGIYSLKGFGILPANIVTEYGLQAGSAIEMCLLSLGLAYKIKLVNSDKNKAERRMVAYKAKLQDAKLVSSRLEVELLKNNIHPHFLLNSINSTIIWLDEDPETAKLLLTSLSDELRAILKLSNKKTIPIKEEVEICKRYLEIMSLRKESKFEFLTEGIGLKDVIPPIVLLTLVENGVTHGYQGKNAGSFILKKKKEKNKTKYILFNDGLPTTKSDSLGTGIKYIKSRLQEAFPNKWEFTSRLVMGGWENTIIVLE